MRKWCIVPRCANTSFTARKKMFLPLPEDANTRKLWLDVIKRKAKSWTATKELHVCEDHFDLETDLEYGSKQLKKNVVPHRFDCQLRGKPKPKPKRDLSKQPRTSNTKILHLNESGVYDITQEDDTQRINDAIVIDDSSNSSFDDDVIINEEVNINGYDEYYIELNEEVNEVQEPSFPIITSVGSVSTENMNFKCLTCFKLFKTNTALRRHICRVFPVNLDKQNYEDCKCVLSLLIRKGFHSIALDQVKFICTAGKPQLLTVKEEFTRNTDWLAECVCKKLVYCWPCLLFDTSTGRFGCYRNSLIETNVKMHETSESHIRAHLELQVFLHDNVKNVENKEKSNDSSLGVINRSLFQRLLDAAIFMITPDSQNKSYKGYYNKLLTFLSKYDSVLNYHMSSQNNIPLDVHVQNRIISTIRTIMYNTIKEEINRTDFVILLFDETSEIPLKSQVSVVLRYLDESHKIQERFLFFLDMSTDRTEAKIFATINKLVADFNIENKFIAYSMDGAVIHPDSCYKLQKCLKGMYPNLIFIHNYSHNINDILKQGYRYTQRTKIFFQTVDSISGLLLISENRSFSEFCNQILMRYINERNLPLSLAFMISLREHRNEYISFFYKLCQFSNDPSNAEVIQAQTFLSFLRNKENMFLIFIFENIFTEIFLSLSAFSLDNINTHNDKISSIIKKLKNITFVKCKELYLKDFGEVEANSSTLYNELLFNNILEQAVSLIRYRFAYTAQLEFFSLLNSKTSIEKLEFHNFKYILHFNETQLKRELNVLHTTPEFETIFSEKNVLGYFYKNKLNLAMPEVLKLAKIITTLPFNVIDEDKSYLHRIKSFCKTTSREKRFSNLAMVIIETQLLADLKVHPAFTDLVYANFNERSLKPLSKALT